MNKIIVKLAGNLLPAIHVDGQPVPAERPRVGKYGGVYTPKKTKKYRYAVADAAKDIHEPSDSRMGLVAIFDRATNRACDIDNLVKTVQDALLGLAYYDDEQIDAVIALRRKGVEDPSMDAYLLNLVTSELIIQ
ncbi:MAG: RusA family crossover junction endodeoxyribonuclease [Nitrososphaera sp.]